MCKYCTEELCVRNSAGYANAVEKRFCRYCGRPLTEETKKNRYAKVFDALAKEEAILIEYLDDAQKIMDFKKMDTIQTRIYQNARCEMLIRKTESGDLE